jgi:hypothetical protein
MDAGGWSFILGFDYVDRSGGDFAERRHNLFVLRFDQRTGALEKLLGAPRRSQDELKSIWDLFETILDRNSCHYCLIFRPSRMLVNEPWRSESLTARTAPARDFRYFSAGRPAVDHSA